MRKFSEERVQSYLLWRGMVYTLYRRQTTVRERRLGKTTDEKGGIREGTHCPGN